MIHSLVTISRALGQQPVTTSRFDWFTVLSLSFVIGVNNSLVLVNIAEVVLIWL